MPLIAGGDWIKSLEIRNLRTFQTVARLLSFNQAAQALNYAQSTVSAQVQALEEELGVHLFDRLGRGILLTEAGGRLLNYADKMLDLAAEARAEVSQTTELTGSLTIRVPESLATHRLPPVVQRFHQQWPGVRLLLITCAHEALKADLRKGVTDLAFLLADSISAADLGVELLGSEPLALVCGPGHPLCSEPGVSAELLARQSLLLTRVDCSYRRLLEGMLAQPAGQGLSIMEINSVAALKQCLARGLGVSLLPAVAVVAELAAGHLVALPWEGDGLSVGSLMVWHNHRWLSPSLAAFMELARKELGRE